jgi:hypothetical protein
MRRLGVLCAAALFAASCSPAQVGPTATPAGSSATPSGTSTAPSPLPSLVRIHPGGQDLFVVPPSIPPEDKPYPFSSPAPPDQPTALDGTYMKIVPFTDRPENQLPIRCFRCIPYRPDVGVSTLILFHGEYYVHHNLSGTKASGNFTVSGSRLTLFNDANCPDDQGTYTWRVHGHRLVLQVERDPCPFDRLRSQDLTSHPWTRVDPCVFRILDLWPAAVAC